MQANTTAKHRHSRHDTHGLPTIPAVGLIRLNDLLPFLPCRRTTFYTWLKQGKFPQPIRLSANMVAWDCQKVHEWLAAQSQPLHDNQA